MVRYQRNNIIFRIASSDAISKFKSVQAGAFVQLARKDLKFDDGPKEVVLLEYDRFSQWLYRIERICLAASEGRMQASLRQAIQESFREEIRVIENVLESHVEVFCQRSVNFVKVIHLYAVPLMHARMDECMDETVERAFEQVVALVSNYLQHILLCMHEFNNNYVLKNKPAFVCIVDSLVNTNEGEARFHTMQKRIEYFQRIGCDDEPFVLKNYASIDFYDSASAYLEKVGIKLIREPVNEDTPEIESSAYAALSDQESLVQARA